METTHYKPAGFWIRALAHLIDGVIIAVPLWTFIAVSGFSMFIINPSHPNYAQLIWLLLGITYYVMFLSSGWQATPGKRLVNVYVMQAEDGGRLTQKRAVERYLAYMGPVIVIALLMIVSPTAALPPGMTMDDQQRLVEIEKKVVARETLTPEDQEFFKNTGRNLSQHGSLSPTVALLNLLQTVYFIAIALSVGLTKYKTGIHDMMCKTRAVRGRPDKPEIITA